MSIFAKLIYLVNVAFTAAFDLLGYLLHPLGDRGSLVVFALLAAGWVVWIWSRFADPQQIRQHKDRLLGDLLAIRLFQNDLGVFLRIQKSLLREALAYLRCGLRPALVAAGPLILSLIQLEGRFGMRPLQVGETILVVARLKEAVLLQERDPITLIPGEGLVVETPGVQAPVLGEIAWRVRAIDKRECRLAVRIGKWEIHKEIQVGPSSRLMAPVRTGSLDLLLHPGEPPIEAGAPLTAVIATYPRRNLSWWGWKTSWSIPFFLLFFLAGYAFKEIFRIEI